jgi:uncharacterized membrane protein
MLKYHLKGSKWIFVQKAKIQLLEKPRENWKIWQNYQRIMSLLQSFRTKIHFDPFKWYFNDIRDSMGVQSIFGLLLQLNWKETTFVTSWKNISTNSIQGKDRKIWQNYQRIMSLLQSFIDKNRVNIS